MSGPRTEFEADECQAILDLMDKMCPSLRPAQWPGRFGFTPEEKAVLAKLREGAVQELEKNH